MPQYKNAQDLELAAGDLSSFDGFDSYVGQDDDFLEFSGPASSFVEAGKEARPFIISLTNAGAATRIALISPGLIANRQGLIVTGAFNDANGAAGLSGASGSPGSLEAFNSFVREYPSMIAGFKVASSNISQMDQSMTMYKESPFKQHSSLVINIGTYASEQNLNQNIITVPKSFFIDSQTRIEYPVLAGTTVTLTLMVGTSLNVAKALRSKTARAKANLQGAGARFIG